jgi:hypothetical protein
MVVSAGADSGGSRSAAASSSTARSRRSSRHGLKAALASSATGLSSTKKIAMIGYSGGAIATEWAAELAPTYAPAVNSKLVGATMGGFLVDPAHNLHNVDRTARASNPATP